MNAVSPASMVPLSISPASSLSSLIVVVVVEVSKGFGGKVKLNHSTGVVKVDEVLVVGDGFVVGGGRGGKTIPGIPTHAPLDIFIRNITIKILINGTV